MPAPTSSTPLHSSSWPFPSIWENQIESLRISKANACKVGPGGLPLSHVTSVDTGFPFPFQGAQHVAQSFFGCPFARPGGWHCKGSPPNCSWPSSTKPLFHLKGSLEALKGCQVSQMHMGCHVSLVTDVAQSGQRASSCCQWSRRESAQARRGRSFAGDAQRPQCQHLQLASQWPTAPHKHRQITC